MVQLSRGSSLANAKKKKKNSHLISNLMHKIMKLIGCIDTLQQI